MRLRASLLAIVAFTACDSRTARVDRLIRRLERGASVDERADAADELGRLRGGVLVTPGDPPSRSCGIGPLPLDGVIERAARALTEVVRDVDEDSIVRQGAARALGQLRTPGPHPDLLWCAIYDAKVGARCEWALLVTADP